MEDGFSLQDATIGIIGLGLMGGSLALSLKGKCKHLIGFDPHLPTLELALSIGCVDQARPHPRNDMGVDILILAMPVPAIIETLQQLPSLIPPCIVMDIGSTKRDIVQAMSHLPAEFDPIGGHPICGKETLGLENAEANLFDAAPFIITPLERTSPHAMLAAQKVIETIGANLVEMTAEEHDRTLAFTSHFPFLLSSALAAATPQGFAPFTGPGFRSTSRLAGTPAHMMLGILRSNRDNVLGAIQNFRNALDEIESALQTENHAELETLLNTARESHTAFAANYRR